MRRKSEEPTSAIVVLGAGRVGTALSSLLTQAGLPVEGPWSRTEGEWPAALSGARAIVIAVRDDAITPVAEQLRSVPIPPDCVVVHCSGARPAAEALAPLTVHPCATMHPLVAVRSAEQGIAVMPRAFWALEGADGAVALCAELVEKLGARWVRMASEQLALYHAAAVIASNHAVVLWTAARDMLQRCGGLDPAQATAMLLPLLASTLENVERFGLPGALTGPLRRGDGATISRHLAALAAADPAVSASYRADASLGLKLLREPGAGDEPTGRDLASIEAALLAGTEP